jgi:hypothetical protein
VLLQRANKLYATNYTSMLLTKPLWQLRDDDVLRQRANKLEQVRC